MTLERRLAALEALLGVEPGVGSRTSQDRAARAIVDGSAAPNDFRTYFQPALPVLQAIIVVRSAYFREAREAGRDPWAWWPSDAAAKIAAIPISESPDARLTDHLIGLASLRIPRPGTKGPLKPMQREVAWVLWAGAGIMLSALGSPDARGLRWALAEGHHDDAADVLRAAGLRLPAPDALRADASEDSDTFRGEGPSHLSNPEL